MNIGMLLELPAGMAPGQRIVGDGSRVVTYAGLRDGAGRIAVLLDELGVARGDQVGIFGVNSIEAVEALFAIAARGAVAVPMNFRAREPEVRHLLEDSGARVLFADGRYRELVESVRPDHLERVVYTEEIADLCAAYEPAFEISYDVEDDEVAVLIYTSGTTALPKGVPLTHGGLSGFTLAGADVTSGSEVGRTLLAVPLYHVAGLSTLLLSLYAGRFVALMPQFESGAWLEWIERERITHAFVVPTMLAKVLADERFASTDLSSLEALGYGAAPMPETVIRRALEQMPAHVAFTGAYGMSETTSTVTVLGPDDHRAAVATGASDETRRRLTSVGKQLEGVEIAIRDASGEAAPAGTVGDVVVRTERTLRAYWRDSGEEGRGSRDEEGWLRTGDLGYLDQAGHLFLVGRTGDMIIRGGENIAPREIEEFLETHPDVVEVGVFGIPDEEWGEQVAAAVVIRDGADTHEGALIEFCRQLASFKRPSKIAVLPELPRTSTGKLIRRELHSVFAPKVER